MKLKAQK